MRRSNRSRRAGQGLASVGLVPATLLGLGIFGAWNVAGAAATAGQSGGAGAQPKLGVRDLDRIITRDGYQFRDLNKNGELEPYEDWRLSPQERAQDLVARMTLEEKVGAMLHINMDLRGIGYTLDRIARFAGAGVSRRADPLRDYANYTNGIQEAAEATRLGIPFAISTDPRSHEGGSQYGVSLLQEGMTLWPQPIGFGAIAAGNEADGIALAEKAGETIRKEYRALGIVTALHPQIDLPTEPRWGRIAGNMASEDAELTGRLGAAYVRGLQGGALGRNSVEAMAKHFPGGGPQADGLDAHLELGKDQVYPGDNFDDHVTPFKPVIAAGAASIMPYYGVPVGQTAEAVGMGFNKEIVTGKLKEELGFRGVVCTDWAIINDPESRGGFIGMSWGVEDLTPAERVAKALEAGADQFGGLDDPAPVIDAVRQGMVPESRLDGSVQKLVANKVVLGLFENPYVDGTRIAGIVGQDQDTADEAQVRSTVLLKNDGALPVAAGRASTKVYIDGKSAGEVSAYGVAGVEDAAEADVAIVRVVAPYSIVPGLQASRANTVFRMHGGPLRYGPYEGASLKKYHIYDEEGVQVVDSRAYKALNHSDLERIHAVVAAKGASARVVVDMFMERPAILSEFIDQVDAVFASFGISDANLLKLVFGERSPTGRLPFALPPSMAVVEAQQEDVPSFEETDIYGSENPFPYGFGLAY